MIFFFFCLLNLNLQFLIEFGHFKAYPEWFRPTLHFLGTFLGSSFLMFLTVSNCVAGWSHHFVSKRKYHMIIPVDDEWNKPLDEGVFDLQTHLLHGLIHCNGFGHLICINGIEGGSKYLCGREVMDLWDRICTNLQARYENISVLKFWLGVWVVKALSFSGFCLFWRKITEEK